MPNWCNNSLTLSGPKDKVKAIFDKAKAEDALLQQLDPMPKELEGTTSPSDGDNWYDWRINNWQTKWDVDVEHLEFREDGDVGIIEGWFDSAWSPPIGAYETFLAKNEDCSIKSYYYEGGMDFGGLYEDGADDCITISDYNADQMEDPNQGLVYDLNEHFNFSEYVREYEQEQKTDTEKFIVDKEAVNV
jgi:hypothetical protein